MRAHAAHVDDHLRVACSGLDFGVLVGGGALLTEVVSACPGVGLLTYHVAAQSLDLPVIMATVIYGAFFIIDPERRSEASLYARLDLAIRPA